MPETTPISRADTALATSTAGTILVSGGPAGNPLTPATLTYDNGSSTLAVPSVVATTGLTTLGVNTTGRLESNRYSCGTPGVAANWAIPQSLFWGYGGLAPFAIGVSGPNPFNGVQDDVFAIGYNSSDTGSKLVISEPSLYLAWESDVFDDADPSGFLTGNTRNFEWDFNQELPGIAGNGTRWLQFRSRRHTMDPVSGFTCWRWVINGQYGIFDVHNRSGDLLFSADNAGNLIGRKSLSLGQPVTGIPGQGDISMGGNFTLGGGGTVSWARAGVGSVFDFSGATGQLTLRQTNDAAAALVVRPFAADPYTAPGISSTKADGTTMAAGLGQSGVVVGSGTLKFLGNGTLSGFGGAEMTSLAGVGWAMASPAYLWKSGNASTTWMTLNSSGLSLASPVTMGDGNHFTLGNTAGTKWGTATNQKQGWWGATPVVQPVKIAAADGTLADISTKFNALLAQLQTIGLQAAS